LELRRPSGDKADPRQKKSHIRVSSIDADAVMAALEDNGFHATDAVGGEFFYARISCGEESSTTRMVGLGRKGEAVWGQVVWLAVERPAPAASKLELELYSSRDKRWVGLTAAGTCVLYVLTISTDVYDSQHKLYGSICCSNI
jgi:hypothetical protein